MQTDDILDEGIGDLRSGELRSNAKEISMLGNLCGIRSGELRSHHLSISAILVFDGLVMEGPEALMVCLSNDWLPNKYCLCLQIDLMMVNISLHEPMNSATSVSIAY